jgi:lipid A 3-O-deacylase
MKKSYKIAALVMSFTALLGSASRLTGAEVPSQPEWTNSMAKPGASLDPAKSSIWEGAVGGGFLPSARDFAVEAGVAPGMAVFGSPQAHDLALLSLSYGRMMGRVKGEGHWYRGNFEGRLELFGGEEYSHTEGWVVGLTPHLRYNFATGTRWIPFLDLGAGVTGTGIGAPDLSGTFQFNSQATAGMRWFLHDDLALTGEVRLMHLSNAGIRQPNAGANNTAFMIGVTRFFGK